VVAGSSPALDDPPLPFGVDTSLLDAFAWTEVLLLLGCPRFVSPSLGLIVGGSLCWVMVLGICLKSSGKAIALTGTSLSLVRAQASVMI
jgi:hypothetical protein